MAAGALSPSRLEGAGEARAFLDVEASLTGRRWRLRGGDERQAVAIAQRLGLPEIVGRVLAARGVDVDQAPGFLGPTLRDLLPDPSHLKDMDEACERLASAIMQGERVAVFGDYDVDGATSSALLARYFAAVDGRLRVYIPDRIKEGYGPNAPALLGLKDEGISVVVTVDCGTGAFEALATAADAGLDVIVVDHHEAEAQLPRAAAIVNPNRLDDGSPHGQLAAVGVAFLLVVGLNRALRQAGWFKTRREPDLMAWLDLVALGTICDVVPLVGVNRALVTQGLKVMATRGNPGLAALADVARLDETPGAYHLGFILGPRVNAGGRVGAADLGARLLATDDVGEATGIARRLDALNRERQDIEAAVLDRAIEQIEGGARRNSVVFAAGEGWHPGVIGIVASRLKERYNLPACVVALDGGQGIGSARSVGGVDIGAAVIAARQAGLLARGGGHSMAAGFTVRREALDAARDFIAARVAAHVREAAIVPTLTLDGALRPAAASLELVEHLQRVGPFGAGNPEPRFAIPSARLTWVDVVGDNHVRGTIAGEGGAPLKAIAFRALDGALGPALLNHGGAAFHLAGRLRLNTWRGQASIQFQIDDAAKTW